MKSNSSGSVPHKSGKKYRKYERGGFSTMKTALDAALKRLGDPVVKFSERQNLIVSRNRRKAKK